MKDMFGTEINIGDIVVFHDTSTYRKYCCPPMFLVGEWEVRLIECDDIKVVNGYIVSRDGNLSNVYSFWFPSSATEVISKNNFEEIPSEMVGNILL